MARQNLKQHKFFREKNSVLHQKNGFDPAVLAIEKGDTVNFLAGDGVSFWPATDLHPLHNVYPEFDSEKPIEKWGFTFNRAGVWEYHDHLRPYLRGEIIVAGEKKTETLDPCQNQENQNISLYVPCWVKRAEEAFAQGGLNQAFLELSSLYSEYPEFRSLCHDMTHLLGSVAYREFSQKNNLIPSARSSFCGYGFYHGFIESLLADKKSLEEGRIFCNTLTQDRNTQEKVQFSNSVYSCYHGLGHGTFDTLDGMLWSDEKKMTERALAACKGLPEEEERIKQCATGVFNALANAYLGGDYKLKFKTDDPLWICRKQEQFSKYCYTEVAVAYIRDHRLDYGKAAELINSIGSEDGASGAVIGYIADEARMRIKNINLEDFALKCNSLAKHLKNPCIEGVLIALLGWSTPGKEYESLLSFCRFPAFGAEAQDFCFSYFLPRLGTIYSKEKADEICGSIIEEKYKKYCVTIK